MNPLGQESTKLHAHLAPHYTREHNKRELRNGNLDGFPQHREKYLICRGMGRTEEAKEEGSSGFTPQHLRSNEKAEKANQTFPFC